MRLLSTPALAAVLLVAWPVAAQASCAGPPEDSPHAFIGTVLSVENEGRVANVVLDDGSRAVVHGSPSLGQHTRSSVDRLFAPGGRYEFHPINDASPFQDNACTATRQLAGPTPEPPEPAREWLPGWLPVDEQAGPVGYGLVAGMAVALLVPLVSGTVWIARRHSADSRRP